MPDSKKSIRGIIHFSVKVVKKNRVRNIIFSLVYIVANWKAFFAQQSLDKVGSVSDDVYPLF